MGARDTRTRARARRASRCRARGVRCPGRGPVSAGRRNSAVGQAGDAVRRDAGDVDAARGGAVDGEAVAEAEHLVGAQRQHREHALLPRQRLGPVGPAERGQPAGQSAAVGLDAAAHPVQLGPPQRPQPVVLQDRRDHRGPVLRRHGVQGAGRVLQGRLHMAQRRPGGADHDRAAGAVGVEPEVLRAADGDEHLRHPFREHPGGRKVRLQAVAQPVVRQVHERHPPGLHGQVGKRLPGLGGRVDAGGVVAAALEQHDVVAAGLPQVPQQALGVGPALRVEPGVRAHAQPGGLQDGPVVHVGGVADPHRRAGPGPADQVGQQPQRTAARDGLDGDGTLGGTALAQHHRQHRAVEGQIAGEPAVLLGEGTFRQAYLGLADRRHDRGPAGVVAVDAEDEVQALGPGVGAVRLGQVPQRVDGRRKEELKHCGNLWRESAVSGRRRGGAGCGGAGWRGRPPPR